MNISSVLNNIGAVFGLSLEEAEQFLDFLSVEPSETPPEGYFKEILTKLPVPRFPESGNESSLGVNDIHISPDNFGHGKGLSGSVKINQSRSQFIYKTITTPIRLTSSQAETNIQKILTEPLINLILQNDSTANQHICKVYRVFNKQTAANTVSTIILRLERLGPTIASRLLLIKNNSTPEKFKEILLKIFGPLFKTIRHLRNTYRFEHSDLHLQNIAFVKDPMREDGTIDESLLHVKIIDFGDSSLVFNGKFYGDKLPDENYPSVLSSHLSTGIFRGHKNSGALPRNFVAEINSFGKNTLRIEEYIIQEADKLTGGFSRNSRKTRRRKGISYKKRKRVI